jgi:hypothetical protein
MVDPATTPQATVVWSAPDAYVVRLIWRPAGAQAEEERFQVLRLRDDKIREMAEYRTLGEATRTAKRLAAPGGV